MTIDLATFKSLIRERAGLSFENARTVKLDYAIRKEMSERGIDSFESYYRLISKSARYFSDLINQLTVNETYFFRERNQLKLFARHLIPELIKRKASDSNIKILSAGCSTGEEPYSLVMALLETAEPKSLNRCKVFGVDIDSAAIQRARKGVYGKQSFRSFDENLRAKYFEALEGGLYKIRENIGSLVEIIPLSLVDDCYPESLQAIDVIFYRNVSIYFDYDMQMKIFKKLASVLNPGGYLITGAAETLSHNLNVLSLIEREGVFFYQKNNESKAHIPQSGMQSFASRIERRVAGRSIVAGVMEIERTLLKSSSPASSLVIDRINAPEALGKANLKSSEIAKRPDEMHNEAVSLIQVKEYDRSLRLVEQLLVDDPGNAKTHALKANILMNLDRLGEAEQASLKAVGLDELCLGGYLVLGVIARERSDHEASIKRFREALYISPTCLPAHFYLAETYYCRGEIEDSRRHYEILLNLAEKRSLCDVGDAPYANESSIEQMVRVCRFKLSQLRGDASPLLRRTPGGMGK